MFDTEIRIEKNTIYLTKNSYTAICFYSGNKVFVCTSTAWLDYSFHLRYLVAGGKLVRNNFYFVLLFCFSLIPYFRIFLFKFNLLFWYYKYFKLRQNKNNSSKFPSIEVGLWAPRKLRTLKLYSESVKVIGPFIKFNVNDLATFQILILGFLPSVLTSVWLHKKKDMVNWIIIVNTFKTLS